MKPQKVFAILVALEGNQFEYYLAEPKIFYDIRAEAQYVVDQVIQSKTFKKQQLKIATLWKITPSNSWSTSL